MRGHACEWECAGWNAFSVRSEIHDGSLRQFLIWCPVSPRTMMCFSYILLEHLNKMPYKHEILVGSLLRKTSTLHQDCRWCREVLKKTEFPCRSCLIASLSLPKTWVCYFVDGRTLLLQNIYNYRDNLVYFSLITRRQNHTTHVF